VGEGGAVESLAGIVDETEAIREAADALLDANGPDAIAAAGGRLADRGWLDSMSLTPVGRAARDRIEERTDQSQQALVDAVGSRLDQVVAVAETISSALVAAGAFPSDPRKRAAG